jgi:predicted RNA binding protein YcfA (HicA-like mRNA interferase family)
MNRIPRVTGSELLAALAKAGFTVIRVKGSHHADLVSVGEGG